MIFLDLHKAYDALDRSRCLEILEGYGVGPPSMSVPLDLLEATEDGGKGGRVLRDVF